VCTAFGPVTMESRPYLDKLVTSPHVPKQPGQVGYCSRKLIPDLSCAGIHSEFQPKREVVTTADGRLTNTFILNAYRSMRDIQRGIVVLNSKEEVFKVGHRQYIDQLLVDMENEKRDKHERRMRHFHKKKSVLGFDESFNTAFSGNSNTWENVSVSAEQRMSDFGDHSSFNCTPKPESRNSDNNAENDGKMQLSPSQFETARQVAVARANNSVRFNDTPNEFPSRPLTNELSTAARQIGTASSGSRVSTASSGSKYGAPADGAKRVKAHSRMALFNTLLNELEPPPSPVKRFGSIQSINSNVSGSSISRSGKSGIASVNNF
jgi:hypothetical protein